MRKQKNDRNIPIYRKWASPLPDIRCSLEKADIFPLPTLAFNEGTISGLIDIIRELAERLELTNEVVGDKIILIKGDLMTVRNCRRAIYRRQDELQPLDRFYWLEPVAGLFHLWMNLLSMLFGKFWGVAGDIVSLNRYSGILKRKHISKKPDNNDFQQTDDFFRVVINAMVIALYMHVAGCSTISQMQTWIDRSDWPALISKVKHDHLGVFKVQYI